MSTFGTRLKMVIDEKKLSLTELARSLGKTAPTVHKWLNGGDIQYETLRSLANTLGVNWVWLRHGQEALADATHLSASSFPGSVLMDIVISERRHVEITNALFIGIWEYDVLRARCYFDATAIEMLSGTRESGRWFGAADGFGANLPPKFTRAEDSAALKSMYTSCPQCAKTGDKIHTRIRAKWNPEAWLLMVGIVQKDGSDRVIRVTGNMRLESGIAELNKRAHEAQEQASQG